MNPTRLACLLAALPLAGCSAPKQTHRMSGFLGDTSELRVRHERDGVLAYERPDTRWLEYERVWIEAPLLVPAPGEDAALLETPKARELVDYFHQRLALAVGGADGYELVDAPGPDVLRVRSAITGLVPVQTLRGASAGSGEGLALNVGGASIEAEMLDSMTGQRLAAFADNQKKRRFGSLNVLSTWNDTEEALDAWAQRLRAWLDRTHGRPTPTAEREGRR